MGDIKDLNTNLLLTININGGGSESIIVPNDNEETIKRAINEIYTENYVDNYCRDWRYHDGYGGYFDEVMWKDVTISMNKLRVLSE